MNVAGASIVVIVIVSVIFGIIIKTLGVRGLGVVLIIIVLGFGYLFFSQMDGTRMPESIVTGGGIFLAVLFIVGALMIALGGK